MFQDPAINLRFRTGFGPGTGPHLAQDLRHGTHKPARKASEGCWADFNVFDDDPKRLNSEITQPSYGCLTSEPVHVHVLGIS